MNNVYVGNVPEMLYRSRTAEEVGVIDYDRSGLQIIIVSETETPTKPTEPETGTEPERRELQEPLRPLNPSIRRQIERIIKELPDPTEQPGGQ